MKRSVLLTPDAVCTGPGLQDGCRLSMVTEELFMKYGKKTLAAGVLTMCLAGSMLAGCGSVDGTATALVINDEKINLGTAAFYLNYQIAETTNLLTSYGMGTVGNIWDNVYQTATSSVEEQTYGDNLKETTQKNLVQAVVLRQHADEYNVTIPDELQTKIDDAASYTYTNNQEALDAMGTTEEDVKNCLELSTIQELMYDPMVADTDTNVSDEEAAESTITYARTALTTTDSSTMTKTEKSDDEKQQLHDELQELLDQTNQSDDPAGFDMKTAASNLDSTNIACTTYSFDSDDDNLPSAVLDAARTLSDGQLYDSVIDTGDYYYIVRMDKVHDDEATKSNRKTIISQRQQDNYQSKLDDWVNASTVTEEKPWTKLEVTDNNGYNVKTVTTSTSASGSESVTSTSGASSTSDSESVTSTSGSGAETSTPASSSAAQ